MIENAAAVLSEKNDWSLGRAAEYIDDLIFNSDEDIPGLLDSIQNGAFEFNPPSRIRKGRNKGAKRDLWKSPYWVQEARILGISRPELDSLEEASRDRSFRRHTPEECMQAGSELENYYRRFYSEQIRKYCRVNEFGIFDAGLKDRFYGIITKQARSEKYWKRQIREELANEDMHALKVH